MHKSQTNQHSGAGATHKAEQTLTNSKPETNMKTKILQYVRPVLAGLGIIAIMCFGPAVKGQDLIINPFDTDQDGTFGLDWVNFRSYVYGVNYTFDATQDSTGNPNSGSMYITAEWPTNSDPNWNQSWNDLQFGFASPVFAPTNYVNCDFDIKVDVANSSTAGDGTYGAIELILNNPWTSLIGWAPLIATNGWQHFSGSLSGLSGYNQEVVIGLVSTGGGSLTNTVSYWLDNIRLTAPVTTNQPTISLVKPPHHGLTCISSQAGGTWQRQIIGTVSTNFSWNSAEALSSTVTYSMTITNFPGVAYSGYEGRFYLINGLLYGQVDSDVDYNATNVVYLAVSESLDGTATASFYYKTNCPSNENFQQQTAITNSTGPLGTWSLTFNNNTNVTLTTPNGTTTSLVIPAEVAADFQGPVSVYLGDRPNNNAYIGQSATFSEFKATGTALPLDDTFATLNTSVWLNSAADPNGIVISSADTRFWLTWPLPDSGFSNVFATDNVKNGPVSSQWLALPSIATGWINVGGASRLTIVNQSALNTAFGYAPTNCFFQLYHP
jgi:hypothetical protein